MGKNHLGMRRSGGGGGTSRVQGVAKGRGGPLAPDIHLKRPYLPETPQENAVDANSPRLQGLEKRG